MGSFTRIGATPYENFLCTRRLSRCPLLADLFDVNTDIQGPGVVRLQVPIITDDSAS